MSGSSSEWATTALRPSRQGDNLREVEVTQVLNAAPSDTEWATRWRVRVARAVALRQEDALLRCLKLAYHRPLAYEVLRVSGIGVTVNDVSKWQRVSVPVQEAAAKLREKWKNISPPDGKRRKLAPTEPAALLISLRVHDFVLNFDRWPPN